MATYAVIADEVMNGGLLYEGALIDQKPPALYATYGVAEFLVGYGRQQIFLLGVVAALATMMGLYLTGEKIRSGLGVWAAGLWAVVCSHLQLEANQPNTEAFINAWVVFGMLPFWGGNCRRGAVIFSGICFALASLYKHVVVAIPAFFLLGNVLLPAHGETRKKAIGDMIVVAAVGALAWAAMFGYFALTGRIRSALDCLVFYNMYSLGNSEHSIISMFSHPGLLFPPAMYGLAMLVVVALIATIFLWKAGMKRLAALLTALAIGTQFAVALPGHYWPHYYQLWYPWLILGSIAFFSLCFIKDRASGLFARWIPAAVVILAAAVQLPSFLKPAHQWSSLKYGDIFVSTDQLARKLKAMLRPGETFWQLGAQPQLYFDTKQRNPASLEDYMIFSGPIADVMSRKTLTHLQTFPPDLVIVETGVLRRIADDHPIVRWLKNGYQISSGRSKYGILELWVKRGSDLERRLNSEAKQASP
jgi:hypothetical protein